MRPRTPRIRAFSGPVRPRRDGLDRFRPPIPLLRRLPIEAPATAA